mgnify:CR=1 FL=1
MNQGFYCLETQKELICEEVKKLLIRVTSQTDCFVPKIDIAPVGRASQLTFLIKVNTEHVFEKTLNELMQFCQEMNIWAEGKIPQLEQLHFIV